MSEGEGKAEWAWSRRLKGLIRRLANGAGYDLIAYDRKNSRWRLAELLKRQRIDVIFDIGANRGAFGWDMRELGFTGRIVSFEPLSSAFKELQKISASDPGWQSVPIGLGDRDGTLQIHIAANSQSSSLLPMLEAHREAAPESTYRGEEPVHIGRLDSIFRDYCSAGETAFVKIDTQGFEKQVLNGAGTALQNVVLIQIESSLVSLYEGGPLIEDMICHLRSLGYDPVDISPTFRHQKTGALMQVDILALRHAASG